MQETNSVSIPGLGRFPGVSNGNHSSILAWKIPWPEEPSSSVHGVPKSQTWLSSHIHTHTHTHTQLPSDFTGGRGTNTSLIYTHICFILFFPLQFSLYPYFINNLFSMLFYLAFMNVLSWWWLTSSHHVNFKCYSLRIQPSLLWETILSTLSKF